MADASERCDDAPALRPEWFAAFLADRGTRKPSVHTMKAYRQDFDAIATLITGGADEVARMALGDITTESMRTAFAQYAQTHEAASIQRCWSSWNVLCTFLYTAELIGANPMPLVGRPKLAKILPKALPTDSVVALLAALEADPQPRRRSDWVERDRALIVTALLAGLRADELLRANVGDLRRTDAGAVVHVRGKGGKDRRVPVESVLVDILERYLTSRALRFPATTKRRSPGTGLAAWPANAPLFVGADGERISRGTLQYRVLRAFRRAGIDAGRARGALVHGLRHTFATELANSEVSVYTLMTLLGHESMVTSQRYVTAAGAETRAAAAQNKLYALLHDGHPHD
ncbi:tyrosine-type recombinase/integrase [Mycolicibacterium austroafricanum]|uniref:Tyrosine-type recombinase/integrase n=1 Tax=Mycolicibacterium austroafricanum TaxID=39687 RepID=A0ABT8H8M1_MYCAO|nr:tyrosine-type recombinase/integrase [Mycolicibacterium austroafricanum]MDN4517107.1 tyrosine-type recombinase/integrase [Mycolicibacterium austroafricanum]